MATPGCASPLLFGVLLFTGPTIPGACFFCTRLRARGGWGETPGWRQGRRAKPALLMTLRATAAGSERKGSSTTASLLPLSRASGRPDHSRSKRSAPGAAHTCAWCRTRALRTRQRQRARRGALARGRTRALAFCRRTAGVTASHRRHRRRGPRVLVPSRPHLRAPLTDRGRGLNVDRSIRRCEVRAASAAALARGRTSRRCAVPLGRNFPALARPLNADLAHP